MLWPGHSCSLELKQVLSFAFSAFIFGPGVTLLLYSGYISLPSLPTVLVLED